MSDKQRITVIFGDCRDMHELPDNSIQLVVTSPPYFNAPFDYPDLFRTYDDFLELLAEVSKEVYRVVATGRVACFVTDDMLVRGEKYPVVADVTKLMQQAGFRYRDKIVWVKPKGYTRISHRSGVLLQHPYPMYFYPDNIQESILIFQKGRFDYDFQKKIPVKREASRIDVGQFNREEWNLSVWRITNVLPKPGRIEEGIAAFPEELPNRIIRLFSFRGETVLDPFVGSGTTLKVSNGLGRYSIGYEIDRELRPIIVSKLNGRKRRGDINFFERKDARNLRGVLKNRVKKQRTVTRTGSG
ncbi:MAG: site-specific DNA-methyltransferase [Thaumarchaeota archaeon]|nr:site-specific DNA-methyltransferase [Nitrososphaerota archaeon]